MKLLISLAFLLSTTNVFACSDFRKIEEAWRDFNDTQNQIGHPYEVVKWSSHPVTKGRYMAILKDIYTGEEMIATSLLKLKKDGSCATVTVSVHNLNDL